MEAAKMANNNSLESKINSLANSPLINFDGSANLDIYGFDFDMLDEGKTDTTHCNDDINLFLNDIGNDISSSFEQFSSSCGEVYGKGCLNTNSLDDEELFSKALQAYYGTGNQIYSSRGGNVVNVVSSVNMATAGSYGVDEYMSGLKRTYSSQMSHGNSNCGNAQSVSLGVPYPHQPHQSTAAFLAAAMIAQQQAMKKRKTNITSQKRGSKVAKKEEKEKTLSLSVPLPNIPTSSVTAVDSLDGMADKEKEKKMQFKEKVAMPSVPVMPGFLGPQPIPANDVRRNLCKLIVNAFHSCDIKKLREVLEQHCCHGEDVVEVHRYEGIQHPHGRNYSRYEGLENILQLWMAVFKSTPDICFDLFNHKTYYDPDWLVVVSCDYTFVGTRIMDVKISQPLVAANGEREDDEGDGPRTPCNDVSSGTTDSLYAHSSLSSAPATSIASSASGITVKEDSLFNSSTGNKLVVSNKPYDNTNASSNPVTSVVAVSVLGSQPRIYVDTTAPFKQPWLLQYKGKLQVFLDGNQKIYKLEFVYTALEEKMIEVANIAISNTANSK